MNRFKQVNDTLGIRSGDKLLVSAGRRLMTCLRSDAIVARLGGDEFAIAFVAPDARRSVEAAAERVIAELSAPYSLDGNIVTIGASVGIAIAETGHADADTLMKNADMALYQAKAAGRGASASSKQTWNGNCSLGFPSKKIWRLPSIGTSSSCSTSRSTICVPARSAGSRRCCAGSTRSAASCRRCTCTHRGGDGDDPPDRALGDPARVRGCTEAAAGCEDRDQSSLFQFQQADIVGVITDALASSGLPPDRLELEITESTLLENNAATLNALLELRSIGLQGRAGRFWHRLLIAQLSPAISRSTK